MGSPKHPTISEGGSLIPRVGGKGRIPWGGGQGGGDPMAPSPRLSPQDMEVSPTELMNILNKVVTRRKCPPKNGGGRGQHNEGGNMSGGSWDPLPINHQGW